MGGFDVKRTILTVLIISAIWLIWIQWFAPKNPKLREATQPHQTQTQPQTQAQAPTPAPPQPPKAEAAKPGTPRPPEEHVEIGTSRWKATFTSYGGALESLSLLDKQYQSIVDGKPVPLNLVAKQAAPALLTTFEDSGFQIPADAAWKVEQHSANEVVFGWQGEGVKVTKTFKADQAPHELTMLVSVSNSSDKPLAWHVQVSSKGWHDFSQKGGFGRPAPNVSMPACYADGKVQKKSFEQLRDKGPIDQVGDVKWVGVEDRYFLLAVAPAPDPNKAPRVCHAEVADVNAGTFVASLKMPEERTAPNQTQTVEMAVFGGPKILKELDAVTVAGVDTRLGEAVDYGWWSPISRVMLAILVGVHKVIQSWGVAIIALTLLIKLLTYPLTQKSMRSGKEMAKLKPKIEAIQKRYKDDKQRMNMEVMNLYKTHGVNPLGGCLPMLIQLPVWWALYATLGNAVELYKSRFLWMHDLTQPDPLYITPILMGIFMFLQQRITPMPTDSQQQKTMMYMMPVLFTFMSLWFPAGLTVYILTNTLLTMLQQWYLNRSDPEKKLLKPVRAS